MNVKPDGKPQQTASLLEAIAAFVLGTFVLVGPVALDPARKRYPSAFLPVVGDAVEGLKVFSLLALPVLGIALGAVFRSPRLLLAFAAVAVFPLWSVVDIAMSGGEGHNLLPVEWMIYAFYGFLVFVGVIIGRYIRVFATEEPPPNSA